jgi:Uma2 family endonuclease
MEAMAVTDRVTSAQYLAMDTPRGTNLVDGEIVLSEPLKRHQQAQVGLVFALHAWCIAGPGRGEVTTPLDVLLDDDNTFAPDVLWYRGDRSLPPADVRPQPLPDIAAEIRSPSTWRYDIGAKKARYEQHGLPELWLVDTAADEVLVFRRSAPDAPAFDVAEELSHGDTLTSPLLPGFALELDELFVEGS